MLKASTLGASPQKIKTYKQLTGKNGEIEGYDPGDQLPLFEMPAATASRAITEGLDELRELLADRNIKVDGFDDLYSDAVHICTFVGEKERRAHKNAQNGENSNV